MSKVGKRAAVRCPVCGDGFLTVAEAAPGSYALGCDACGCSVTLREDGYNAAEAALRDMARADAPVAENWATDPRGWWRCSRCDVRRRKVPGDPAFRFCPDCGERVWSYV